MPVHSQRHPSRDQRPTEWTHTASGELHFRPGGHYQPSELSDMTNYWHAEGSPEEGHHMTRPSQGTLFNADAHETKVRQALGERRMEGFDPWDDSMNRLAANDIRNTALSRSVIPTSHLQPRPGGRAESAFVVEEGLSSKGALGHYTGPADKYRSDYITVDPEGPDPAETAIHEMGHRHHLGTTQSYDPRTTHPRGTFPDPLMESVADAYEDRYGGPGNSQVRQMKRWQEEGAGPFRAYQHTGYSTHPEYSAQRGWTDPDRAVYAASRAHFSETGEIPQYVPTSRHKLEGGSTHGDPTIDATLHTLLSHSPHAAQALRQTGLKDVGAEAFRRHRDRQLLTQGQQTQMSLLHDVRGVVSGQHFGYTPTYEAVPDPEKWESGFDADMGRHDAAHPTDFPVPRHMSHNQFGEAPRTQSDVSKTLGVDRWAAKQRGFE